MPARRAPLDLSRAGVHDRPVTRRALPTLALMTALAGVLGGAGCTGRGARGDEGQARQAPATQPKTPSPSCDPTPRPAPASPGVPDALRSAAPWIAQLGEAADQVLLDGAAIEATNRRGAAVDDAFVDPRTPGLADPAKVASEHEARSAWIVERVTSGAYVEGKPGVLAAARKVMSAVQPVDELRVATAETPVWCLPSRDGIYTPARDLAFDRNRCSTLRAGEAIRVLEALPDGTWYYVHGGHSVGWIHDPAWTPALEDAELDAYLDATPRAAVLRDDTPARPLDGAEAITLRVGVRVPLAGAEARSGHADAVADGELLVTVPTPSGLRLATVPADRVHAGPVPLTRRHVLELAFSQLGDAYGWGGHGGGRDCSRYLHDLLVPFGIALGRNSAVQSGQGSETIELAGLDDAEKLKAIDAAHARGLVLLYMRGHIMLYLGRHDGVPYAISSLSEYLEPCPHAGGPDRVFRLDRVEVTTLELGRETARTAFLERLERAVLFAEKDV